MEGSQGTLSSHSPQATLLTALSNSTALQTPDFHRVWYLALLEAVWSYDSEAGRLTSPARVGDPPNPEFIKRLSAYIGSISDAHANFMGHHPGVSYYTTFVRSEIP